MALRRALSTAIAVALTALSLTACGGGAPDDASAEEFCTVWNVERTGNDDDSQDEQVDAAHESAEQLDEVGTPEDIDDGARHGFEVFVDYLAGVDTDDLEQMDRAADEDSLADAMGISEDDGTDVLAFFEYATVTCSVTEDAPTE